MFSSFYQYFAISSLNSRAAFAGSFASLIPLPAINACTAIPLNNDKLSFSNGYIIFHHAGGIKLCPDKLPHQIDFESGNDILTQGIEIFSIIQNYYPDVQNKDEIQDLVTFDGNKILFHYQ